MLETPRFRRLDGMKSAERRHSRDVAQYVLVGGNLDGRTALYTGTQLAASAARVSISKPKNVCGVFMERRAALLSPARRYGGQSSSGNITVMAGLGSSRSSGPQVATSFTSLAARSSLRT